MIQKDTSGNLSEHICGETNSGVLPAAFLKRALFPRIKILANRHNMARNMDFWSLFLLGLLLVLFGGLIAFGVVAVLAFFVGGEIAKSGHN